MTHRVQKFLVNLIPVVTVLAVLAAMKILEPIVVPVITRFVVHEVHQKNNLVTISGTMVKERDTCVFESVTAYSLFEASQPKQRVPTVFLDNDGDDKGNRSAGPQKWGPWRITIPVSPRTVAIELTSLHSCHWLWGQSTRLAVVPLVSEQQVGGEHGDGQ